MTTVYGSWVPNSTNNKRMRLRLNYTVPSVSAGQTSVTVTGSVYVEAGYSFNDSHNTFSWSGSLLGSGSTAKSINVATGGSQQIHTFSKSVTLTNSAQGHTVAFSLTGIDYVGSSLTASVSATVSIPAKVYNLPAAPTAFVMTRVSDTRHDSTWSATATAEAPIDGFEIEKWRLSTNTWVLWTDSVSGSSRSWSDTTTTANDKIQWRIRSFNAKGVSAWAYSNSVWTTPAAATNVTVEKSGTVDALVEWTNKARDAVNLDLQTRTSSNGGSTWTSWANVSGHTSLSANTTSRVVTGLNGSLLHQYRVVTRVTTPSTLLAYSSASNSLQPLTAPLAPTLLSPKGTLSTASSIVFDWNHNPVDTTAQTAYELQYRVNGGSWVLLTGTTATSRTVAAGGIATGTIEWQVRTKGQHASFSPWSAIGSFIIAAPPTVSITSPAAGAVITSNKLTLAISYSDPQGAAMTAWRAEFYKDGALLETRTGNGSVTSITSTKTFPDLTPISANVRVTAGTGLQSSTVTWSGSTDFLEPAPPRLEAEWNKDAGQVQLTIESLTTDSDNLNLLNNSSFERSIATVEVWRNLIKNPSFEVDTTGWFTSAATLVRESASTYGYQFWMGAQSGSYFAKATADGTSAYLTLTQTTAYAFPVTPGQWIGVAVLAASDSLSSLAGRGVKSDIQFRDSGGVTISYLGTAFSQLPWYAGGRIVYAVQVPANAATGILRVQAFSGNTGTNLASGQRLWADSAMAVQAATEEFALAAVQQYFDGANSPHPDFTSAWTGTANDSESLLLGAEPENTADHPSNGSKAYQSGEWSLNGNYSAKVVGAHTGTDSFIEFTTALGSVLEPNTTYTIEAVARLTEPLPTDVAPRYQARSIYLALNGAAFATSNPAPNRAGEHVVRMTFTTPATVTSGFARLYNGHVGFGSIWWDNAILVEGNYTGTYDQTVPLELVSGAASASHYRVERSIDRGETWQLVEDKLPANAGVGDLGAALNTYVWYRAIAVSSLGTEAVSYVVEVLTATTKEIWLSTIDGQLSLRLYYNLQVSWKEPNDVVFEEYYGDVFPTEHFGPLESWYISVSAVLTTQTEVETLRLMNRKRLIYRDFDGQVGVVVISASGISRDRGIKVLRPISLELTRVTDY